MAEQNHDPEFLNLKEAIAEITLHWAMLENSLSFLLNNLVSNSGFMFGNVIYFAPTAAEVRFKIVHVSMTEFLQKQLLVHQRPVAERYLSFWNRFYSKLKDSKEYRNKVVHGPILPSRNPVNGREQYVIAQYMFHPNHNWGEGIDGLTINDLSFATQRMRDLCGLLVFLIQGVNYFYSNDIVNLKSNIDRLEEMYRADIQQG